MNYGEIAKRVIAQSIYETYSANLKEVPVA